MFALKVVTYCLTIAAAMLFEFLEVKLKQQLSDDAIEPTKLVSDITLLNDISENIKRERFLKSLPREKLSKYRFAVGLKFLFIGLLIAEVIFLQK